MYEIMYQTRAGCMKKGFGGLGPGKYAMGDGLRLDVGSTGKSTWVARIRINGSYTTRKLAAAGPNCGKREARNLLGDLKARAMVGQLGPGKRRTSGTTSLGQMMQGWAADKSNPTRSKPWSERHRDKTEARIKKALGVLWDEPMETLKLPVLNTHLVDWVMQGNSRDTAGRVWSWVREAWDEQVNIGTLEYCPMVRKPECLKVNKGNRFPSYGNQPNKLRVLYRAIELSQRSRSVRHVGQLCILTGLRISEIRKLMVPDVRGRDVWVPRERMKVKDARRKSPHFIVPLSSAAIAIIQDALEAADGGYLFPGPRTEQPIAAEGVEKMYQALTSRAHTPHGCRTSLLSWSVEQDYNPIACKTLLDHAAFDDQTQTYADVAFLDERRKILEAWGELITRSSQPVSSIALGGTRKKVRRARGSGGGSRQG